MVLEFPTFLRLRLLLVICAGGYDRQWGNWQILRADPGRTYDPWYSPHLLSVHSHRQLRGENETKDAVDKGHLEEPTVGDEVGDDAKLAGSSRIPVESDSTNST